MVDCLHFANNADRLLIRLPNSYSPSEPNDRPFPPPKSNSYPITTYRHDDTASIFLTEKYTFSLDCAIASRY
jgi:hypothetical protein